ncbi:hypothetical protein AB0F42_09985 [Streptomyces buecherae]|uniref:hypothetical protein n=1 Tax=Streptomyces buecherae TaxID=2763006 RepID=UPI0033DACBDF
MSDTPTSNPTPTEQPTTPTPARPLLSNCGCGSGCQCGCQSGGPCSCSGGCS